MENMYLLDPIYHCFGFYDVLQSVQFEFTQLFSYWDILQRPCNLCTEISEHWMGIIFLCCVTLGDQPKLNSKPFFFSGLFMQNYYSRLYHLKNNQKV